MTKELAEAIWSSHRLFLGFFVARLKLCTEHLPVLRFTTRDDAYQCRYVQYVRKYSVQYVLLVLRTRRVLAKVKLDVYLPNPCYRPALRLYIGIYQGLEI